MRIAALDIGGTSIKSGVWDGTMVYQWKETPTNASEGGVRLMERAKEILREYAPFDAVGISTDVYKRQGKAPAGLWIPGWRGSRSR